VVETDAKKDIHEKIQTLLQMVMPSGGGASGTLTSPGPKLVDISKAPASITDSEKTGFEKMQDSLTGFLNTGGEIIDFVTKADMSKLKDNISLHIGRFIYYKSVVITDVDATMDTKFDYQGLPVRAQVNISFRTFLTPVKEDLSSMFFNNGGFNGVPSLNPYGRSA